MCPVWSWTVRIPYNVPVRQAERLADEGKTPLMFGLGDKLLGIIAVADVIKEDSTEAVKELLSREQVSCEDISYYLLHQANERIIRSAARRLGEDISKFPMNMDRYGNTSSASLLILLDEMKKICDFHFDTVKELETFLFD